jgi:transposase
VSNPGWVERAAAEAIYDSGREACVEFLVDLANRVAGLEEGLAGVQARAVPASSRTGSSPPSADLPVTRQQRRAAARAKAKELQAKTGKQRKAGGQDGHRGAGRELLPPDQMQDIVDHYPDECHGCGHEFRESEKVPRYGAGRHQVAELPVTAVFYVEHRTQCLRCPECAKKTRGRIGREGESAFGPLLQSAVVTLSARNRISRRDMSELLGELFQVGVSVGAIDTICQRASALLEGPHERLLAEILACGAINVDETGWFLSGENRWMWTATTKHAAVFRIAADRHSDRLVELLGKDYPGVVTSDRWWAYNTLPTEKRQACWSHLVRDFRAHSEGLAAQQEFGLAALALTDQVFATWKEFAGHQDRDRLALEMKPVQDELHVLLEHAGKKSVRHRLHRGFANNLLKIWPALWTFLTVPGVTPTNNAAERALRGPVIHRKLSHGSQSDQGERFTERALSASVTCRLQHRSLYHYLSQLFTAHQHGGALPALL